MCLEDNGFDMALKYTFYNDISFCAHTFYNDNSHLTYTFYNDISFPLTLFTPIFFSGT